MFMPHQQVLQAPVPAAQVQVALVPAPVRAVLVRVVLAPAQAAALAQVALVRAALQVEPAVPQLVQLQGEALPLHLVAAPVQHLEEPLEQPALKKS